jgi:anthranilate synthase component 1
MGITIRSMGARGDELFWQAGGGIVHVSDPELEWKEVCNKSAIMRMVVQAEDEGYVPGNR